MRIDKIEISGNRRLLLNNIKVFTHDFSTDLLILVGTNGCGKSTILDRISPLPGSSNDYVKGGYEIKWISHNNNKYRLESQYNTANKHFFYAVDSDGKETNLNEGYTSTVQHDLIRLHFNYTPEIHRVLTWQSGHKFTEMSGPQRKHWITLLNDSDLTYANSVLLKAKGRLRDTAGALKHVNNRLAAETQQLLSLTDIEGLEDECSLLKTELTALFPERISGLPSIDMSSDDVDRAMRDLGTISDKLLQVNLTPPMLRSIDSIVSSVTYSDILNTLQQEAGVASGMYTHYSTEYCELESVLNALSKTGVDGVEELRVNRNELISSIEDTKENIRHFRDITEPQTVLKNSDDILEDLVATLQGMPANIDGKYSKETYDNFNRIYNDTDLEFKRLENRVQHINQHIDELLNTAEIDCPSCKHKWKPGATITEDELKQRLKETHIQLKQVKAKRDELEESKQSFDEYLYFTRKLNNLKSNYPRMWALWEYLLVANRTLLMEAPASLVPVVYDWKHDVRQLCIIESLEKELAIIDEALKGADRLNAHNDSHFSDRLTSLKLNLQQLTSQITVRDKDIKKLNEYSQRLQFFNQLRLTYVAGLETLKTALQTQVNCLKDNAVSRTIDSHHGVIAASQSKLNERKTYETIVENLQRSHVQLTKERLDNDTVIAGLEGLIKEQLLSSVASVTDYINSILTNCWSYTLQIQPCSIKDGALDYTFPLFSSKEHSNLTNDIREGSTAQVDMINFAFVLSVYRHLGLEQYPLYLDELGRTFDPENRSRLTLFLNQLQESREFSQVIMVSHYSASYGGFANSTVLSLDSYIQTKIAA